LRTSTGNIIFDHSILRVEFTPCGMSPLPQF